MGLSLMELDDRLIYPSRIIRICENLQKELGVSSSND